MEYADGGDLVSKIKDHKQNNTKFTESEIWDICIQLIRGLRALHDNKILHRDLKSANIFLCNDGTAKIGDMNISKIIKNGLAQTMVGTPYYASPEIWLYQPYDSKCDIWSLGCVLYEMSMLNPPFIATELKSLYRRIILGRYSAIGNSYSKDLVYLIKRMLCVNPETRPSSKKLLKMPEVLRKLDSREVIYTAKLLSTIRLKDELSSIAEKLPPANYNSFRTKTFEKSVRLSMNLTPHSIATDKLKIKERIDRSLKHKHSLPPLNRKFEISRCKILSNNSSIYRD